MPGITGIIERYSHVSDRGEFERMLSCMMYESFYDSGTCSNDETGVCVGWVGRDSCSGTCAWNDAGSVGLILSGELFSASAPDREPLLRNLIEKYEKGGAAFLEEVNGCFNGLLIDVRQKSCTLFNDRFGLGRVYVHESPDTVYFSSEAKALLRVLPETRRLDARGLGEWLSCGCVLQNRTLFSGIELLPPGSAWVLSTGGKLTKNRYFDPACWESQPALPPDEYYNRLRETFHPVLGRYVNGGQRAAMSLTGGLDGRMIMAWAKSSPGSLPCYTFGGPYRDCSDVRLARKVAKVCQQPHKVLPVGNEFLSGFGQFAERAVYISDGAMDVTGSVELYANRLARKIAPARLTGNYGSEILRRNVAFRPAPLDGGIYDSESVRLGREAVATYAIEAKCHPVTFIAFKQVPWHHYSRLSVEQSQLAMRSPYLDNDLVALAYQAPVDIGVNSALALRLIAEGSPALGRIPTDRGLTFRPAPLVGNLRNFCQEFTIKAEYAYDYGMPQWLARMDGAVSQLHFERLFLGRHKFYHFRIWYRDRLGKYLKEVLLDSESRSRPHLRSAGSLEKVVNDHLQARGNYTSELHQLLTLELIHRTLLSVN